MSNKTNRPSKIQWTVQQACKKLGVLPHDKLLVACSMGVDSASLLHIVSSLSHALNVQVHAVYCHHGLRKQSDEEGELFLSYCKKLNVDGTVVRLTLLKKSIQQEARTRRYEGIDQLAQTLDCQWILTGHTLSDQAETFFMRLIMGAGSKGLGGIPDKIYFSHFSSQAAVIRPMLTIPKHQLIEYAKKHAIPYLDDVSNFQDKFLRNRIRNKILPMLFEENPQIESHLANLSATLRQEAAFLRLLALENLKPYQQLDANEVQYNDVPIDFLQKLPDALFPYVMTELSPIDLSREQINQIKKLLIGEYGEKYIKISKECIAKRTYKSFNFIKEKQESLTKKTQENLLINGPGIYHVLGGILKIEPTQQLALLPQPNFYQCIISKSVDFPWVFRRKKPGDRFQFSYGTKKISDWLVDKKIPRTRRDTTYVLEKDALILWFNHINQATLHAAGSATNHLGWMCTFIPAK